MRKLLTSLRNIISKVVMGALKVLIPIAVWALLTILVATFLLKPPEPEPMPVPPSEPSQQEVLESIRLPVSLRVKLIYLSLLNASGHQGDLLGIYVIHDPRWNAFITGNNEIYLFSGMLRELKSDDEIAFVIAHEISHAMLGHTSPFRSPEDSRYSEFHADLMALILVQKAGYDPCAAHNMWARAYKRWGIRIITTSHPSPAQRALYLLLPQCTLKEMKT